MLDVQTGTAALGSYAHDLTAPCAAGDRHAQAISARRPRSYTLMDLVAAVSSVTDSEAEVVAVVASLLESGRVRLSDHPEDSSVRITGE